MKTKKQTVGAVQIKAESMSMRGIRTVGLTKGCAFASVAVPREKRVLCSKCDDQGVLKFAHHLPLGSVNVCCENIKMNCGSSSDKSRINEYMSD